MNPRISNTQAAKRTRTRAAKAAGKTVAGKTGKSRAQEDSAVGSQRAGALGSQRAGAVGSQRAGARGAGGGAADEVAHRWTFLTNHAHVLIVLHGSGDLVLREVARRVGITERAVQRIVQDLEQEGFIRRQKVGRKNQYEVLMNRPLRHPLEAHRDIGDLLTLISGE